MKAIIFKGIAPICFSGTFGEVVLKNGGVLNRVDDNVWKEVEKQYSEILKDFIDGGFIIFSKTKAQAGDEVKDIDAAKDEIKEAVKKQNENPLSKLTQAVGKITK